VQELAGHTSLAMTQRYIEGDTAAKRKLVALLLLKRVFRVSFWFVYARVQQAGLVPPNAYPRLITEVKRLLGIRGRAKMEELEPELLPRDMRQRSARFARLIRSAFLQGKIGIAKVAEILQIPVAEVAE
jgi:hypothetical protein